MVHNCAHCGSFDIIAGQDHFQCLSCGFLTHADGTAVAPPESAPDTTWFGRRNVDGGHFDSQES